MVDESHVKEILQRWVEGFNNQDVDSLGELSTEDYVWHRPGRNVVGIEGTKVFKNLFETGIPTQTLDDLFISGDKTVTRWNIRVKSGTSGVEMVRADMVIDRIRDSKFAETWEISSEKS